MTAADSIETSESRPRPEPIRTALAGIIFGLGFLIGLLVAAAVFAAAAFAEGFDAARR